VTADVDLSSPSVLFHSKIGNVILAELMTRKNNGTGRI
jgi:hypothetical protein